MLAFAVVALGAVSARADETTLAYGPQRTAWDAAEAHLGPADVASADFGQLFSTTLPRPAGQDATTFPNQVYAQPLVADGKVIVATEENQVDALDPITGSIAWTRPLGPAWTPTTCGDLVPHIGITSTPVYDPVTKTIYLVTKTDDGPDLQHPHVRLHALNADSGAELSGWPVEITGLPTNSTLAFNPVTAGQRAALLLLDGAVYIGFASHCDQGPYVGYVAGVNVSTRHLTLWSDEAKLATDEAGIWQSGGGLMSDGTGRIFLATGNGVSPAPSPDTPVPSTLAESVVRLGVNSDGSLTARDFFSPANNAVLDQGDKDLGSGAPVALPDGWGSASHPHLLVIAGKDGVVRLLDRDHLGGMGQGPGGTDAVVSSLQLTGVWGRAALFSSGSDHYVYLVPSNSPMQALRVVTGPDGNPALSVAGTTGSLTFPYTSGSPVVTSNGTDTATALAWVVRSGGGSSGTSSTLLAFPAVPPASGPWNPVYSAPLGTMAKFVAPATDGGRVYVGTRDGRVLGFGRPVTSALIAPETEFGMQAVNTTSAPATVTVTAQAAATVNSVGATGPFTAGTPSVTLPHALAAGDSLTVPVTFTPTATGSASGMLQVLVGASNAVYAFALHGTGTIDGLAASPSALSFGAVPVGTGKQLGVTILNSGTTPASIQSVMPPTAPFGVTGLPSPGTTLAAQQSTTVTVQFAPGAVGNYTGQFTIAADTGSVTVTLSGSGFAGTPTISVSPSSLAFGQVQPSARRTLTFRLTNTGTATLQISKAAVPSFPFVVPTPIPEGQTLAAGDSLSVSVTVAPVTALPARSSYVITGNDGLGAHSYALSANTGSWIGPVSAAGECLRISGSSVVNGAPAVAAACDGSTREGFSFGASGSVRLGAATSTWCLDVRYSGTASGTPVQIYHCNGTAAQQWTWRADSSLYNPHSAKCLTIPSTTTGARLQIAACRHLTAQYWNLSKLPATRGEISSGVGALYQICLTDKGSSGTAGTPMVIAACNASSAQLFTHHARTLNVFGGCVAVLGTGSLPAVGLARCTGAAAQLWDVHSDGTVHNAATGTCLTVPGSVLTPGTAIVAAACGTTRGQRWTVP